MDIEKLKAENDRLQKELSAEQGKVTTLTEERDKLKDENATLTSANSDLQAKVDGAPEDLSEKVASLTSERDQLKTDNEALTQERDQLKAVNSEEAIEKAAQTKLISLAADAGIPLEGAKSDDQKQEEGSAEDKTGYDRVLAATKIA